MAIQALLESPCILENFHTLHLDTTDRRGIEHANTIDWQDVFLFFTQFVKNIYLLSFNRPDLFYIPISQSRIGFLRDSFFIIPALFVRSKVVVHLHGGNLLSLYSNGSPIWKKYMNTILGRAKRFVVLGEMLKNHFHPWTDDEKISTVPNGIPDEDLDEAEDRSMAQGNTRPFRVLFLSTLLKQKGVFVLLNTIPHVLKVVKNVHFLFGGFPGTKDIHSETMTWIHERNLNDCIEFVGPVVGKDKSDFLRSGDVFVFPGIQQEGQPLVVLEAMRAGLPVVTTDRGCLQETVIDGKSGFIVPPNSPEALASKILVLLQNHKLRHSMRLESRKRFEQEYTLDRHTQRIKDVLFATLHF